MNVIFKKILGDHQAKNIKRIRKIVEQIDSLSTKYEKLTDTELKAQTEILKKQLKKKNLDQILPDAFAVVREAASRSLKQRHFDVQLIGGIVLHEGNVSEMKTGEGKTLVATAPVYLNALTGKGVHVVTVNDYLAQRDAGWMGQVYDFLGLKAGVIIADQSYVFDK
ncbi:MAG: preprotein translocase subunit SecA, partial [bacterium]